MHAKTDSDATSLAASSPPRSPRRPMYYVRSPSHADAAEKMSLGGSSPGASPHHYAHHHLHLLRYASSPPIHHSRESTARYSAPWRKLSAHTHSRGAGGGRGTAAAEIGCGAGAGGDDDDDDDDDEGAEGEVANHVRRYACFFLAFVLVFTLFSLILWGASKSYKPKVFVKSVVFESYYIQAGMDYTGVPTKMMSLNSTVRIAFRNPGTFFGVHVTSTPLHLFFYDLKVASGYIKEFYQPRRSGRMVTVAVGGRQVPLYGGGSGLSSRSDDDNNDDDGKRKGASAAAAAVPLNLTFVVRARAHVLGYLVRSKFYHRVRCALYLHEAHLGSPVPAIATACHYRD